MCGCATSTFRDWRQAATAIASRVYTRVMRTTMWKFVVGAGRSDAALSSAPGSPGRAHSWSTSAGGEVSQSNPRLSSSVPATSMMMTTAMTVAASLGPSIPMVARARRTASSCLGRALRGSPSAPAARRVVPARGRSSALAMRLEQRSPTRPYFGRSARRKSGTVWPAPAATSSCCSWRCSRPKPTRPALGLGLLWSAFIALQPAGRYFITARVPLGADIYAYSLRRGAADRLGRIEILSGGPRVGGAARARDPLDRTGAIAPAGKAAALAVVALWMLIAAATLCWVRATGRRRGSEGLVRVQPEGSQVRLLLWRHGPIPAAPPSAGLAGFAAGGTAIAPVPIAGSTTSIPVSLPAHRQTPMSWAHILSCTPVRHQPRVHHRRRSGRSFPGLRRASEVSRRFFDQLAARKPYWDNFLAARATFAVLPSILVRSPTVMRASRLSVTPAVTATLLSLLKGQGYRLKYLCRHGPGVRQSNGLSAAPGRGRAAEKKDFGPGYTLSNDWGYADNELVSL